MPTFTELKVWQTAYALPLAVYKCSVGFPAHEAYGLTSQMRRAAVSVGANLAEGQRRRSKPEFRRFVSVAEGSLAELQHHLMLARDLGYLSVDAYAPLAAQAEEVERMLVGLYRSLEAQSR